MRYSISNTLNSNSIIATDTNYTWDFSQLTPNSQSFDEYQSVNSTSIVYSIAFIGKANQASPRGDMGMMNISINNGYNFFSKNSSQYKLVGYGGEMNGTPIPVVFNNADVLYRFPMVYGNVDSCDSDWDVSVPGTGYIEEELHRVNTIDGWGTLITPIGTYTCLRLKSEVLQDDSIYITSSSLGMRIPQRYTEYKWFAKGMNFPIMKATVPAFGQSEIMYLDSIRQFISYDQATYCPADPIRIRPNPATDLVKIFVNPMEESQILILDCQGKTIYSNKTSNAITLSLQTDTWAKGMYFVRLTTKHDVITKKLIIQ
jgi:hypothetical protein